MSAEQGQSLDIEAFLSDTWQRFTGWQKETHSVCTFDIPEDLWGVFMPRRLLELQKSGHLPNLKLALMNKNKQEIALLIYQKEGHDEKAATILEHISQSKKPSQTIERFKQVSAKVGIEPIDEDFWSLLTDQPIDFADKLIIHYGGNRYY